MVPLILVLCVRALHISLLYLLHAFIQAIQRLRKAGVLDQIRPGSWEEKLVSHEWDVGLFRCRLFGYLAHSSYCNPQICRLDSAKHG